MFFKKREPKTCFYCHKVVNPSTFLFTIDHTFYYESRKYYVCGNCYITKTNHVIGKNIEEYANKTSINNGQQNGPISPYIAGRTR